MYTIFQRPRQNETEGVVVALTSANRGEGVTFITRALVNELSRSDSNSVAQINARFLRKLYDPTVESLRESMERASSQRNVCDIGPANATLPIQDRPGRWEGSWQYRRDCVTLLRREFDYSIIDCPSLRESGDVLSIAPFVDGVVMVIEANHTRAEQLRNAERNIEAAQGKLLGHVLNKRTYDVPGWLYHSL
jgi:Mrp family chromosome partitioning ATPase